MGKDVDNPLKPRIMKLLLKGESPRFISKDLSCSEDYVYSILGSADFANKIKDLAENSCKVASLEAVETLKKIMLDNKISAPSRINAAKAILDKATEITGTDNDTESPANMSQRQLAERLKALQAEASERAKPIDTGVIDMDNLLS
jgi:hypothetical protein